MSHNKNRKQLPVCKETQTVNKYYLRGSLKEQYVPQIPSTQGKTLAQ